MNPELHKRKPTDDLIYIIPPLTVALDADLPVPYKMRNSIIAAAASLALGARADIYPNYEYGNMFYLGPTTGGQYITKATYSMEVPNPPTNWVKTDETQRWLSLWIGVQDNPNNGDVLNMNFVQPLLNWGPDNSVWGCSAPNTQWCAAASTYQPSGQIGQAYVPVNKEATLEFEISLNSSTDMIDQKIWQNGDLISSESDSKGMRPAVFYSGNECYGDGCGTLPAYKYTNITLVFDKAVTNLADIISYTNATHTEWQTKDNGITWTVDSITIAEDNLTE
ncbi:uncharacterized protein N0V96_012048 [Colletotrichum fioriniae]|uniref:uncharacterized protein n=1 Tax=Colletotrichum fioriniae TaxID=710243 RepID=UPI0023016D38|nr:uncharacterized protein COL516b_010342 [Colletotrichum fioriniae]KAJ0297976.1 hypothetical protein COL516b_010342 [Colletotrichum fioriniae]KAJ3938048.1 hypothetical protein N0V96_012048 [Colletotrichum fioriniae]